MTNHLWQSTLFAIAAALLTLAFRKNRAPVRYWLWFSASVKFLIPFSLLIGWGSRMDWPASYHDSLQDRLPHQIVEISEPFDYILPPAPVAPRTDWVGIAAGGIWLCGFACVAMMRFRGWLRVRAAVQASIPMESGAAGFAGCQLEARCAPGLLEPGVFGLWRPVLLLPADIMQRLTTHQLEAVLAHELCHVRRRDNLTAAIHMIVEALFWFHPFVWWIGARLVDERERACDEEVLRLGSEPHEYAEGILNVCKSYLESPLRCVSGVTGSDLKKRIHAILTGRVASELNLARKIALAVAGIAAVAAPVVVGIMNAPFIRAQSAPAPKFEVAAIKPCGADAPLGRGGGNGNGRPGFSPGTLNINCATFSDLIQQAYATYATGKHVFRAHPPPIVGAPAWVSSERYSIEAKAEGPQGVAMMHGPMMQALMEDRLKLKLHRESREVPVYILSAAKGSLKNAEAAKVEDCIPFDFEHAPPQAVKGQPFPFLCGLFYRRVVLATGLAMFDIRSTTMANFAEQLAALSDRDIVDKTGISGTFDIHVEIPADELSVEPRDPTTPSTSPDQMNLILAVVRRLGLRLESGKGAGEIFVIDHIERPSEN